MKYLLLLASFFSSAAFAQQKESTVSVSCYVNPQLYLQAGIIAYVSDKAGNISCSGRYVSIVNQSGNSFFYQKGSRWFAVKPRARTTTQVIPGSQSSSGALSVVKLGVRYFPDASDDVSTKIKAIARMNGQTDKVKNGGSGENIYLEKNSRPADNQVAAAVTKPAPTQIRTTSSVKAKSPDVHIPAEKPKPKAKTAAYASSPIKHRTNSSAPANGLGLRVDFGTGDTGFGPNFKHRFTANHSLDGALLFYKNNVVGLSAQYEYNSPVQGAKGLDWYAGIGPQFLFRKNAAAVGLVPVAGLEYKFPGAPFNLDFDWRPAFYVSPQSEVEAGRFGLSFRVTF